ncbi:DUF397 domain-containing protein [Nocardiopsis sp. LDBS1602]|uniref:DUF397 domain-containing protein n=1 Tax=Nocardiopsis sp. LDBS1602 TaxID=3109597 RepID=UPI002DBC8905|nr:DUF397 domain-containing protein [Nocardiopsis sp. LDBS1602]MEC3891822.1 DUF397 domain-containing protein [Nocardiopsis sp. LDBS1602]
MLNEQPTWHKSSYSANSANSANCVEVAEGPTTHLRDTQNRALAELNLPAHEWSAFLTTLTR